MTHLEPIHVEQLHLRRIGEALLAVSSETARFGTERGGAGGSGDSGDGGGGGGDSTLKLCIPRLGRPGTYCGPSSWGAAEASGSPPSEKLGGVGRTIDDAAAGSATGGGAAGSSTVAAGGGGGGAASACCGLPSHDANMGRGSGGAPGSTFVSAGASQQSNMLEPAIPRADVAAGLKEQGAGRRVNPMATLTAVRSAICSRSRQISQNFKCASQPHIRFHF